MTESNENCSDGARELLSDIPIPQSLRSAEELARYAYRRVTVERIGIAALVVITFVAVRKAIRCDRPGLIDE